MSPPDRGRGRGAREPRDRSPGTERRPADIVAEQMARAKLARLSQDWQAYERARDVAVHRVLGHRIEDEVSRFRQVMTACTGRQNSGETARELILKALTGAFMQGVDGRETAQDLTVRMQRVPRAQATVALVREMRRSEGEICISVLLSEDGHMVDDVRAGFGDDPARIAARFTDRDWVNVATPLMHIAPGETRQDVMAAARTSLRATLSSIASR